MAANMLVQTSACVAGWTWTTKAVDDAVANLNEHTKTVSAAKIGSWKLRSVKNLLVNMPRQVYDALQNAYLITGWEKSFMSEDLLRQALWKPGFRFTAAANWTAVYTVTESTLLRFCELLAQTWEMQLAVHSGETSLQDLESKKPMKAKVDDPEYQSMTVAQVHALRCLVFENWMLPLVGKEHGDNGTRVVEKAWTDHDLQFIADLDAIIKLREQSASFGVLKISSLPHTHTLVSGASSAHFPDAKIAASTTTKDKFESYKTFVKADQDVFKAACDQRTKDHDEQLLYDLSESSKVAKAGVTAVGAHRKRHLAIHIGADAVRTSTETTVRFVDDFSAVEDAPGGQVPLVVVWDLNGLTTTQIGKPETLVLPHVYAFKAILATRPNFTVGLVILRRTAPTTRMSRRSFHNIIASLLEKEGINIDLDLALNYKQMPRQKTTLVVPCYVAFCGTSRETNIFAASDLLKGSLTELTPATYNQMTGVTLDGEERRGNALSISARLQYIPPETFVKIIETAFEKIDESTTADGVGAAVNKDGQPLVATSFLEPNSASVLDAVFQLQQQQPNGKFDLRAIVIVEAGDGKAYMDTASERCMNDWFQGKLKIANHPRIQARSYTPKGRYLAIATYM